jgi:hypothetical protein
VVCLGAIAAHTEVALVADRLARHDEWIAAIEAAVKGKDEQIEAQVKIIRGVQEAARNALVRARETLDISISLFNAALRREPTV